PAAPRRRLRRVVGAALGGLLLGTGAGVAVMAFSDLPAIQKLEDYTPPTATRILDRNGQLVDEVFLERREPVKFDEIPDDLKNALVATEDAKFYHHHGVDFLGLTRAVLKAVLTGHHPRATSTLTQQLAKNLFLTPERSLKRKLKEAALAFQIERAYTKPQILTLYLNEIYLGSGTFGVEAASQRYFGKHVKDLDLAQCALLAGLPKSPSGYDPFLHADKAKARRHVVLLRMVDAGYLSEAEMEKVDALGLETVPEPDKNAVGGRAPYFIAALKPELESRFGEDALYTSGLQVWTTLDVDAQAAAEAAVAEGVAAIADRQADWARRTKRKVEELETPQGALLAIDPRSGDVLALVGGTSWQKTQFNRALNAKRQPGSSFKPIYYAAAVEQGWTQSSALWDAPIKYVDRVTGKAWEPKNFYKGNLGRITLRTALEQSSNDASIYLLERIGVQSAVDEARRLGITAPLQPNLTLALGASDVTLVEMTRAYAAFANGGVRTDARMLLKVLDRNGRVLYEAPPSSGRAVMSPENAYVMADLLHGVASHGLSHKLQETLPFWVGGKTGTTNSNSDAWFLGFDSNLAAGVWVGLDSHTPMIWGESGSHAAQPIWLAFMEKAAPSRSPATDFPTPPGIVRVDVDPATGEVATAACAEKLTVAYVAGTEPTRACAAETGTDSMVAGRYSLDVGEAVWDESLPH
ncbi:MAG TPA: PBP1A family penicillin-binding protein, partial [bacterium]|nr:PBP1A family penicillin-binding protein [bacterium]